MATEQKGTVLFSINMKSTETLRLWNDLQYFYLWLYFFYFFLGFTSVLLHNDTHTPQYTNFDSNVKTSRNINTGWTVFYKFNVNQFQCNYNSSKTRSLAVKHSYQWLLCCFLFHRLLCALFLMHSSTWSGLLFQGWTVRHLVTSFMLYRSWRWRFSLRTYLHIAH